MPTQPTAELKPAGTRDEVSAQTVGVLVKLTAQVRVLQGPTLCLAVASLGAGVLAWFLSYASYLSDSFTSALVCLAMLVAMLLPGAFLGWVYGSFRGIRKLAARLNLPAGEIPTEMPVEAPGAAAGGSPVSRLWERLQRRSNAVLGVWSLVQYHESIKSVGGPRWFLAFLAWPFSQIAVAVVLLANAVVLLMAVYAILRVLLGSS